MSHVSYMWNETCFMMPRSKDFTHKNLFNHKVLKIRKYKKDPENFKQNEMSASTFPKFVFFFYKFSSSVSAAFDLRQKEINEHGSLFFEPMSLSIVLVLFIKSRARNVVDCQFFTRSAAFKVGNLELRKQRGEEK